MALSRRKKLLFALVTTLMSLGVGLALLLAADLVLHHRAERSAGLNRYGYRGPVVGRPEAGELRVVMLGGSTAFGYGVAWNEAIPARLEAHLKQRLDRPVTVVNLGFNNEGAFAFVPNLEDFAHLEYDVIVLYEGYNDLMGDDGPNRAVYRRASAIYRWTGYYPILPTYLDEKAMQLRYGKDLNAAYEAARQEREGKPVVFRPTTMTQRTSAAAVEAMAAMTKALNGQFERTNAPAAPAITEGESTLGCAYPFVTYCESVAAAIRVGRQHGKGVVVGLQPALPAGRARDLHALQRQMLARMVATHFGGDARVVCADAAGLVDLNSIDVTFDAMHLKPEANDKVAAALLDPVLAAAGVAGVAK